VKIKIIILVAKRNATENNVIFSRQKRMVENNDTFDGKITPSELMLFSKVGAENRPYIQQFFHRRPTPAENCLISLYRGVDTRPLC
jgi:hypothetical protein